MLPFRREIVNSTSASLSQTVRIDFEAHSHRCSITVDFLLLYTLSLRQKYGCVLFDNKDTCAY